MTETSNDQSPAANEVVVLDLLVTLAKNKKIWLGLPFLVALVVAGYSLTLQNVYTATARILPPQVGGSTTAAILAQLSGNGAVGAASGLVNLKSASDIYVAMLKSRTLADRIVDRFDLIKVYSVPLKTDARKILGGSSNVIIGRDGVISIEVDDSDPKRAADMANAYIEELYELNRNLAVTEASQRRLFFEQQLKQAKDNLTVAEASARTQLDKGGVVKVDDQGRSMILTAAQWRARISAQEVQISAMRTFATENNPALKLAQQELIAMRSALARLEDGSGKASDSQPTGQRAKGQENLRALRDVKYYETLYELLAKQYEVAKLEESRDATLIQVLDKAVEPERKSRPMRASMVLTAATIAFFAAIIWIWLKFLLERASTHPAQSRLLREIRSSMLSR